MNVSAKRISLILLAAVIAFLSGTAAGLVTQARAVSREFVRFHIVANSDSYEDQKIKQTVREQIFSQMDFSSIDSKEDALWYFQKNQQKLLQIVTDTLVENGFSYGAAVCVDAHSFPVREYDGFVLPSGIYDAVCVTLGRGEGQNFFCVMYPSLCMVEGVYKNGNETLDTLSTYLSENDCRAITGNPKHVVIKFKIAELLEKIIP